MSWIPCPIGMAATSFPETWVDSGPHGGGLLPRWPHSPREHSGRDCARLQTLGSVLAGSVNGWRDGCQKAMNPQTSFNVSCSRKPEKRRLPGLRAGVREEEKMLPNLDINNDGPGTLLATGCCNSTCSALQTPGDLCQPAPAGNVT